MAADEELSKILSTLHDVDTRFADGGMFDLVLDTKDAAAYSRLTLEARSIIDESLGPLNAFSQRVHAVTTRETVSGQPSPSRLALHEVCSTIEGAINTIQRKNLQPVVSLDALTKLLDRGSFDTALTTLAASASESAPLALVFCDVDHFKRINDSHGHDTGDTVLVEIARRLIAICGHKGNVYRYGGEEIVILLPNFDRDEALALAERVRRALEAKDCAGLKVTASFGVSVYPTLGAPVSELVKTADAAMYDAKDHGRNLVRYFGEAPPSASPPSVAKPARKAPVPGGLTESMLAALRDDYFSGLGVFCPTDGTRLRTHESKSISPTVMVSVHCPKCGFSANV